MEQSRNIATESMRGRARRAFHFLFDQVRGDEPHRYRPSAQRDVGKTAAEAAGIQMVIHNFRQYEPSPHVEPDERTGFDLDGNWHVPPRPFPQVERTDAAQLAQTQRYDVV